MQCNIFFLSKVRIHFEFKFGVYLLMLGESFYIYFFPTFSASTSMNKSLPKISCYNTPETVLFVTESDGEECDRTIDDEIGEELSEVNLPLSDGKNDDLMESGDSEK